MKSGYNPSFQYSSIPLPRFGASGNFTADRLDE